MFESSYYVLIESLDRAVKINGRDTWLCLWSAFDLEMVCPMEEMEEGKPWKLQLTILKMTDEEYEAYCEEHEIDRRLRESHMKAKDWISVKNSKPGNRRIVEVQVFLAKSGSIVLEITAIRDGNRWCYMELLRIGPADE